MPGEELRGLYIDIDVRSADAKKEIKETSEAADDLSDNLRGIWDDAAYAVVALENVEQQAESTRNSLLQAATAAGTLGTALRSLPSDALDDIDLGDVDVPEVDTDSQKIPFDVNLNSVPNLSAIDFPTLETKLDVVLGNTPELRNLHFRNLSTRLNVILGSTPDFKPRDYISYLHVLLGKTPNWEPSDYKSKLDVVLGDTSDLDELQSAKAQNFQNINLSELDLSEIDASESQIKEAIEGIGSSGDTDTIVDLDELVEVEGIGQGTIDKIKESGIGGLDTQEEPFQETSELTQQIDFDVQKTGDFEFPEPPEFGGFEFPSISPENSNFEFPDEQEQLLGVGNRKVDTGFLQSFSDLTFDTEGNLQNTYNLLKDFKDLDAEKEFGPTYNDIKEVSDPYQQNIIRQRNIEIPQTESEEEGGSFLKGIPSTIKSLINLDKQLEETGDDVDSFGQRFVRAASGVSKAGEEAEETTGKLKRLQEALTGLSGTNLRLSIGPLSAQISSLIPLLLTIVPSILSLTSAIGGLGVAALAVGGVLGGAFYGGLLGLGEKIAKQSSEAKNAYEGIDVLMKEFKKAAEQAMEPLQGPVFQQFSLDILQGAIKYLSIFSEFAAAAFKDIQPLVDVVAGAFWENTPEFFSALHYAIKELGPAIAGLMQWIARGVPDAIVYLTDVTKDLIPELTELGDAFVDILPQLIWLGSAILEVVLPAIELLVDGLDIVLSTFQGLANVVGILPGWMQNIFEGLVGLVLGVAGATIVLVGAYLQLLSVVRLLVPAFVRARVAAWASSAAMRGAMYTAGLLDSAYAYLTSTTIASTTATYARATAAWVARGALIAASAASGVLTTAYNVLTGSIWAATIAEYAFLAPILLIVGAIAVLIGFLYVFENNMWGIKSAINSTVPVLGDFLSLMTGILHPLKSLGKMIYAITHPLETLRGLFSWFQGNSLKDILLGSIFMLPIAPFLILGKTLQMIIDKFGELSGYSLQMPNIQLPQIDLWGAFSETFPRTAQEIREKSEALKGIWGGLQNTASNLKQGFDNLIGTPVANWFNGLASRAKNLYNTLSKSIPDIDLPEINWEEFIPSIDWQNLVPDIEIPKIDFSDFIPDVGGLVNEAKQIGGDIGSALITGLDVGMATILSPIEMIPNVAEWWYNAGANAIDSFIDGLFGFIGSLWGRFVNWGKGLANTFVNGLTSINIVDSVVNWLSGLIPFMPSSDAQKGPLSNLTGWGKSFGQTIINGILSIDIGKEVGNWLNGILQGVKNLGENIYNTIKSKIPSMRKIEVIWNTHTPNIPEIPSRKKLLGGIGDIGGGLLNASEKLSKSVRGMNIPGTDKLLDGASSIRNTMADMGSEFMDLIKTPSMSDIDPLINAGNHLKNQLASGASDITNSTLGSVDIPSVDQAIGFADSLSGFDEAIGQFTTPEPTRNTDRSSKVNISPNINQRFKVEIDEATNPAEVRREIEKVSSERAVNEIVDALKSDNVS